MKEEENADIHGYEWKVQTCIRRIEKARFADEDKLLIKSYLKHVGAQGVSRGRVFKIAWTLLTLRRNIDCAFSGLPSSLRISE